MKENSQDRCKTLFVSVKSMFVKHLSCLFSFILCQTFSPCSLNNLRHFLQLHGSGFTAPEIIFQLQEI